MLSCLIEPHSQWDVLKRECTAVVGGPRQRRQLRPGPRQQFQASACALPPGSSPWLRHGSGRSPLAHLRAALCSPSREGAEISRDHIQRGRVAHQESSDSAEAISRTISTQKLGKIFLDVFTPKLSGLQIYES